MENETQKNLGQKMKFGGIAAVLIIVGLYAGYILGILAYAKIIGPYLAKIKYQKAMEEYLKPYKEDVIGGDTPEQTIDLFVDALKKGDYELAVKYFEIQEQPRWTESFKTPNRKNIDEWISEIESNRNTWHKEQKDENSFEFWYNTGQGETTRTISIYLRKNINNKWKIEGF